MKLGVTEKQLKNIISEIKKRKKLEEQGDSAQSSSSTTSSGGAAGYPQVSKWESGVTRGPANQLGITKWSDVVGSTLKRGKANPLN